MVCLWLKYHHDVAKELVRQQAEAFQLQLDTLRTELQATRGLLQNRPGGGEQSPQSMRLDVLKFLSDDLDGWILAITGYFSLLNTPADEYLQIVEFILEGAAAEWFWWMSRNGLITTWARFKESVKNHFGPSKYEDMRGDVIEAVAIRLKLNQQHELLVSRPTLLGDAFSLARIIEAHFEAIANYDTLLSLRSEDPNFKIQEKAIEYVRALNAAMLKVVFAGPVDEVSSLIEDIFDIDESKVEGMKVRHKFADFFEDKGIVEKVNFEEWGFLRPGQRKLEEGKE
ncbi:hypothetical protein Tco_0716735 [Tanacetum coccineum]